MGLGSGNFVPHATENQFGKSAKSLGIARIANSAFTLDFSKRKFAGDSGGGCGNEMRLTRPNEVPKDSVPGSRQIRSGLLEQ